MFHFNQSKLNLFVRNEGKIKSYESCFDIRAWSHDEETRVRYFRDWIRCDMPICVIPVSTVTKTLKMMSWRRRGLATPSCRTNCEAKVVLDSICNSCHAIKECFKDDVDFQKYFEEERFETTHWPCERCLEALKIIKMFWRIILEKIFKIKLPKCNESHSSHFNVESVKSVARCWQEEIVEQAIIVKSLTPFINEQFSPNSSSTRLKYRSNGVSSKSNPRNDVSTDTDFIVYNTDMSRISSSSSLRRKVNKSTSGKVKTVDVGCSACAANREENNIDKYNLDYLQQRFNLQNDELKQLKRDNISLKLELRNLRKKFLPTYSPILSDSNAILLPKPFESCFEDIDNDTVKDIESEMIITMKNCKNKNFRHVSMLQVLHQTNDAVTKDTLIDNRHEKTKDPIEVLTKVHNTFGAIVKRELRIANKKKMNSRDVNIDAYHKLNENKYDQRLSAKSSYSNISDSIFVSATQVL